MGFGAREPRPGDRGRGAPEWSERTRRPADQDVRPARDDRRDGDGGWSLLDPVRPDPLNAGDPDGRSDAPWYDHPDARAAAGDVRGDRRDDRGRDHRHDAPDPYRPGGFDRSWSSGLAGPGPAGHDRDGAAGEAWSEYDRIESGRRRAGTRGHDGYDGYGAQPVPPAAATGRRAAPARPSPFDGGHPDDERRPRPVPAYEPDERDRYGRAGTDGRRAPRPGPVDPTASPEPGWPPRQAPGAPADGYGADGARPGRRARPEAPDAYEGGDDHGRWADARERYGRPADAVEEGHAPRGHRPAPYEEPGDHGRPGRHGPGAHAGPAVLGGEPGGYARNGRAPGAPAYAPGAPAPDGPARTGRHGGDRAVPGGLGREGFDADGYNLDGLGRDGYDRDGFDLYGFDREGYDRHGFDREGYDRDGYPADADGYPDDDYGPGYAAEYDQRDDPRDEEAYGYATGYGPDGYRPGRRRAYDEQDGYEGYAGYEGAAADAGPEGTLTGGELPVVAGEPEERDARASRRGTGDRRRRRWPWVVGAAAVAAAVAVPVGMSLLGGSDEGSGARDAPLLSGGAGTAGLGASGAGQSPAPGAPVDGAAQQPAATQVTYEVNGAGKAGSITFGRGTSVAQIQDAGLPWKQESPAAQGASDYSLSAVSSEGGDLSCRILLNGAVIAENSAKGDYSAVACTGRR